MSPLLLDDSTYLQGILTKELAKSALSRSVPTRTEALLLLHEVVHVSKFMGDGRLHADMELKVG